MDNFDERYWDDPVSEVDQNPPRSPFTKKLLTVAVGLTALVLGQTFAANISIGNSGKSEFGQGVRVLAACSGNTVLTLKPELEFSNVSRAGAHYVKSIVVSNVPNTCAGLDLTVKVFGETGTAMASHGTNQTESVVYFDGSTFVKGPGSGYTVTGTSSSFTITFTEPAAKSSLVKTFTIESGGHTVLTCVNGGTCSLGDTGPGGGKIFFASSSTFNVPGSPCGANCKFLEYAPISWGNGISVQAGEFTGTSTDFPALYWCGGTGATNYVSSIHTTDRNWVRANTFGLGYSATEAMANNCTSGAGKTVFDLTYGGNSDWFLPSMSEMNELCKYIRGSAGQGTITTACAGGSLPSIFPNTHYWTSTESDETPNQSAYLFFLGQPNPDDDLKGYTGRIIPIRAFS
ncbi:MAG: hypothetical protein RL130_457 [Actinomycetota bacterium]